MKITEHLDSAEVACKCGCHIGNDGKDFSHETALAFEQLRRMCCHFAGHDIALIVSSGYRCEAQNEKVGGSKDSEHMKGDALDVHCPSEIPIDVFHDFADKVIGDSGGMGKYWNRVHIDTRGFKKQGGTVN